jgi:hypothetical protein
MIITIIYKNKATTIYPENWLYVSWSLMLVTSASILVKKNIMKMQSTDWNVAISAYRSLPGFYSFTLGKSFSK